MSRFRRSGLWWLLMGFTRTHAVGIFLAESLLCTLGIVAGTVAVFAPPELSLRLLVGACCLMLLAIAIIQASMLSLHFFLGGQELEATASQYRHRADRDLPGADGNE